MYNVSNSKTNKYLHVLMEKLVFINLSTIVNFKNTLYVTITCSTFNGWYEYDIIM